MSWHVLYKGLNLHVIVIDLLGFMSQNMIALYESYLITYKT